MAPFKGQAALSTVFLIGGIIVLFGISLAMIALAFSDSTLGFQAANKALALAKGGLADGELQLARNKDFSSSGYCVPAAVPPCASGSATVTITQNSPVSGEVTIVSDATYNRRRRKVQGIYSIATSTQVIPVSMQELAL